MSRNRSGSYNEYSAQNSLMLKKNPQVAAHASRGGLMTGPTTNQLFRTPVAVAVSVTGERTLCPADAFVVQKSTGNNNPFAIEHKESGDLESTSEELIAKFPVKKPRSHIQKRRKFHEKDRRRTAKIILTQRNSARSKPQVLHRCASVQTDPSMTGTSRSQECIGDPGIPSVEGVDVCLPEKAEKKLVCVSSQSTGEVNRQKKKLIGKFENTFIEFMPERVKILTLYVTMVMLIFWMASIISDVDVPFDFFKMATNYVRSFKWGYYRKEPQTSAEKCLEFFAKFFK